MTIRALVRGDARTISPQLRDAITDLYDAWWDKRAPGRTRAAPTLARNRAIAGNWCAAAALDDDQLDDSRATGPEYGRKPAAGTVRRPRHPPACPSPPQEEAAHDQRPPDQAWGPDHRRPRRPGAPRVRHACDDQHAGRAVGLIGDLARVYEGVREDPARTRPCPQPGAIPAVPRTARPRNPDRASPKTTSPPCSTRAEASTVLAALDLAADWTSATAPGRAHDCPDQSCPACQTPPPATPAGLRPAGRPACSTARQAARPARSQPGLAGSPMPSQPDPAPPADDGGRPVTTRRHRTPREPGTAPPGRPRRLSPTRGRPSKDPRETTEPPTTCRSPTAGRQAVPQYVIVVDQLRDWQPRPARARPSPSSWIPGPARTRDLDAEP